jgi:hypothetical protein
MSMDPGWRRQWQQAAAVAAGSGGGGVSGWVHVLGSWLRCSAVLTSVFEDGGYGCSGSLGVNHNTNTSNV